LYAQTAAGIGLGIKIDKKGLFLGGGHRSGEVDGGRGLAHAALLITKSNNYSHLQIYCAQGMSTDPLLARKIVSRETI
jgi:hypothetical protein